MSYVEFISLLKETNRCPGGKDTIHWILQNSFANSSSSVLEIGSNTGFSSLEVARTIKCKILGIDPVPEAVKTSHQELAQDVDFIKGLVRFEVASAYDIPVEDNSIDLIIAGGSTSFMDDKQRAVREMYRVLKPWGLLSVTNLFYHTPPPARVLDQVSETIGVTIHPMTSDDWVKVYTDTTALELYRHETVKLRPQSEETIDTYINYFMVKPHLAKYSSKELEKIRVRWRKTIEIFNENHKYLGFIRALLRKRTCEEEPELFKV